MDCLKVDQAFRLHYNKRSRHRLPLCHSCPPHYLFGACRACRLPLYCGTTHNSVVSVPYPLMKAMQTGKEKVYHKAVNVGFYGSLFHQCTSAICSPDFQGLIGFTSYHDLFLRCVMRSVAAFECPNGKSNPVYVACSCWAVNFCLDEFPSRESVEQINDCINFSCPLFKTKNNMFLSHCIYLRLIYYYLFVFNSFIVIFTIS